MRSSVLALLLLAAPVALAEPPPGARAQKEQGDRLRQAGEADGATRAYQAALQLDGGYAEAHEALGELQYAGKQMPQAIESFGRAVAIDPTYALAWYNLAFAARRSGDQARARAAYEQYVKLRPTDPDGHYGLAETLRVLDDRAAAIAEYQLFIDLAQNTPAQGPWVEKARAAQAELKAGPPAAPARLAAPAVAGAAAAMVTAPATSATPVVTATPAVTAPGATTPPPPTPLGAAGPAALAAVGLAPTAPAFAAPPAPGPPPPVAVAPVAASPAGAAGVAAARPPAARPTPAPPTRELIEKLGAGDRAYLQGDYRTALFAYQDATYLDATRTVARIKLARAYAALGHKDQAERQLSQALELDPGNAEAQKALEDLARPAPAAAPPVVAVAAPAVAAAVAAAGLAPPAPPSQRVYRLTDEPAPPAAAPAAPVPAPQAVGDQQEASRHYRAALTMIGARDFKGAIVELDQALAINPQLGVAVSARASAFYGLGRYQDAARDYETAMALLPQLATPIYGLAEACRRLGDPRAADLYLRYADSGASDVRPELRDTARQRAAQLGAP